MYFRSFLFLTFVQIRTLLHFFLNNVYYRWRQICQIRQLQNQTLFDYKDSVIFLFLKLIFYLICLFSVVFSFLYRCAALFYLFVCGAPIPAIAWQSLAFGNPIDYSGQYYCYMAFHRVSDGLLFYGVQIFIKFLVTILIIFLPLTTVFK